MSNTLSLSNVLKTYKKLYYYYLHYICIPPFFVLSLSYAQTHILLEVKYLYRTAHYDL